MIRVTWLADIKLIQLLTLVEHHNNSLGTGNVRALLSLLITFDTLSRMERLQWSYDFWELQMNSKLLKKMVLAQKKEENAEKRKQKENC